jgi:general nucleoside transport system permease protein
MLKLEARPQASRLWTYASPLLALALTVVLGVMLFVALGKDPMRGLQMFFWEPLKSGYALGELMVKATPLLLIALGLAVCFRSNVWNIGAEGQFVIGAVCASGMALLAGKETGRWIVLAVILAGVLGGMLWAGLTALLRDRFNASEILVSLMLVYVADMVLSYLVYGPWKDPAGYNFPQTKTFEAVTQIPRLMSGSRVSVGLLIALCGGFVGVFVPHPGGLCPAGGWLGPRCGALCGLFFAQGAVGGLAHFWGRGRFGGRFGSGRPHRSAHALCACGLWFCRHHRGLCRALAPGGHGLVGRADEHVLHRWRVGAIALGPAQVDHRGVPGLAAVLFAGV